MGERKDDNDEKVERENPEPSKCLGVFNLPIDVTEKDLNELFFRFGKIDDISIVLDKVTSRSRGFAFIYFKELEDAEIAKEKVHGINYQGKNLRVDFSITQGPHPPTPGEYKGTKPTRKGDHGNRGRGSGGRRGRGNHRGEYQSFNRERSPVRQRYDSYYDRRSPPRNSERRPKDWTDYYPAGRDYHNKSRYD